MGTQVTTKADRTSTEKILETEVTNKITGLNKEIIASKTGTAAIKTEIDLITEDDQTNTNTTATSSTQTRNHWKSCKQ